MNTCRGSFYDFLCTVRDHFQTSAPLHLIKATYYALWRQHDWELVDETKLLDLVPTSRTQVLLQQNLLPLPVTQAVWQNFLNPDLEPWTKFVPVPELLKPCPDLQHEVFQELFRHHTGVSPQEQSCAITLWTLFPGIIIDSIVNALTKMADKQAHIRTGSYQAFREEALESFGLDSNTGKFDLTHYPACLLYRQLVFQDPTQADKWKLAMWETVKFLKEDTQFDQVPANASKKAQDLSVSLTVRLYQLIQRVRDGLETIALRCHACHTAPHRFYLRAIADWKNTHMDDQRVIKTPQDLVIAVPKSMKSTDRKHAIATSLLAAVGVTFPCPLCRSVTVREYTDDPQSIGPFGLKLNALVWVYAPSDFVAGMGFYGGILSRFLGRDPRDAANGLFRPWWLDDQLSAQLPTQFSVPLVCIYDISMMDLQLMPTRYDTEAWLCANNFLTTVDALQRVHDNVPHETQRRMKLDAAVRSSQAILPTMFHSTQSIPAGQYTNTLLQSLAHSYYVPPSLKNVTQIENSAFSGPFHTLNWQQQKLVNVKNLIWLRQAENLTALHAAILQHRQNTECELVKTFRNAKLVPRQSGAVIPLIRKICINSGVFQNPVSLYGLETGKEFENFIKQCGSQVPTRVSRRLDQRLTASNEPSALTHSEMNWMLINGYVERGASQFGLGIAGVDRGLWIPSTAGQHVRLMDWSEQHTVTSEMEEKILALKPLEPIQTAASHKDEDEDEKEEDEDEEEEPEEIEPPRRRLKRLIVDD